MKRKLILLTVAIAGPLGYATWYASSELLFPSRAGLKKDLAVCNAEIANRWGEGCGDLRKTGEFKFSEAQIRSINGYQLPGWLIGVAQNGTGQAQGAIMLIHGGGNDRREETRYVRFFLDRRLDVLTLDLGCHGEAPCPVPGMTYGNRESRDVLSAYLFLVCKYKKVYAMGTSVGAASILVALPEMPKLTGVVVENPMVSFRRLIADTPESRRFPGWFASLLFQLTMLRGRFDELLSPENSLRLVKTTPIFFIHSKLDTVIPYQHTQELANLYAGPKILWLAAKGSHALIWNADPAEYDKRLAGFLSAFQ